MMKVIVTFKPTIYQNEYLNNASSHIGSTSCMIAGKNETELFKKIEEKIWTMSGEASINDKQVAEKYNRWIANQWHRKDIPAEIDNMGQRDMRFALPYSENFKKWLRKFN